MITFLKTKHSKASPSFLSSVEFRNTLGRCLTRAQTNRSKTFVYINELCTVLRQHGVKKRQNLTKPETSTSASFQFSSVQPKKEDNKDDKAEGGESNSVNAAEDEKPSTSDMQEDSEAERKAQRKSRKQVSEQTRAQTQSKISFSLLTPQKMDKSVLLVSLKSSRDMLETILYIQYL